MMSTRTLSEWQGEISAAAHRIRPYIRRTPLDHSAILSEMYSANVYFKLESEQITGSFKIRGAFNKVLKLQEQGELKADHGPTFASTGNHALACIHALKTLGVTGKTFVPSTISELKEAALKRVGADLVKHGQDCMDAETAGRRVAQDEGRVYISPYNDLDVMAGQGTIGVEIHEDLSGVDVVYVPVGGGGLIGGISAYLKATKPNIKIVGCQPVKSKVMYESLLAGKIIFEESEPTLSEGTAGGIEDDSVTFDVCRHYVDDWVLVSEEEIRDAVYFMVEHHHKIVEGATGVTLGGYMKTASKYRDQTVVIITCGSNIGVDVLKSILNSK